MNSRSCWTSWRTTPVCCSTPFRTIVVADGAPPRLSRYARLPETLPSLKWIIHAYFCIIKISYQKERTRHFVHYLVPNTSLPIGGGWRIFCWLHFVGLGLALSFIRAVNWPACVTAWLRVDACVWECLRLIKPYLVGHLFVSIDGW